jgi:hypothetical protein
MTTPTSKQSNRVNRMVVTSHDFHSEELYCCCPAVIVFVNSDYTNNPVMSVRFFRNYDAAKQAQSAHASTTHCPGLFRAVGCGDLHRIQNQSTLLGIRTITLYPVQFVTTNLIEFDTAFGVSSAKKKICTCNWDGPTFCTKEAQTGYNPEAMARFETRLSGRAV